MISDVGPSGSVQWKLLRSEVVLPADCFSERALRKPMAEIVSRLSGCGANI